MVFRELVIAAAAVEIFSPGAIEEGAKKMLSAFGTLLRNMPPVEPQPSQVEWPPISGEAQTNITFPECGVCHQQTVFMGVCFSDTCRWLSEWAESERIVKATRQLKAAPLLIEGTAEATQPEKMEPKPAQRTERKQRGRKRAAIGKDTKEQLKYYCDRRLETFSHNKALEATAEALPHGKNPQLNIARKVAKYLKGGSDLKMLRAFLDNLEF